MNTCNPGRVSGLAVGAFGGASAQIRDLAGLFACELSAEHLAFFAVHRGWTKLLLDRRRGLLEDPRQPRTHARETDEDGAGAHGHFHFHQARGRGGHYRNRPRG